MSSFQVKVVANQMNEFKNLHAWIKASQDVNHEVIRVDSLPSPRFKWHGQQLISFSSNNYLSLASDPRMIAAAQKGLAEYGVGNCESRLLGGDLEIYRTLEAELAALKRKSGAIIFATGYLTNLGALSTLVRAPQVARMYGYRSRLRQKVMFFTDEFNHLSIREGIRASGADKQTYPHLNLNRLEDFLRASTATMKIIVTDGVFSQDGDIAPLPGLVELADRYDALVYVDDAHGTGVLGASGGGISDHFSLYHPRVIHMGTLSKAYGAIGGFIAADSEITEVLRMASSAYGFTSTLPPDQAFAVCAAIDIVRNEPERRQRLWDNQRYFCAGIKALGYRLVSEETPILPLLIGDETMADRFASMLRQMGFHVDSVKFPAVGMGQARLRFMVNANHTRNDIDALLSGLEMLKKRFYGSEAPQDQHTNFSGPPLHPSASL
jgi:glycine C-acetyltransferase